MISVDKLLANKGVYVGIVTLGVILSSFVLFSPFIPESVAFSPGDIATQTIVSTRYLETQTKADLDEEVKLRDQVRASVGRVYSIDTQVNEAVLAHIGQYFTYLKEYVVDDGAFPEGWGFLSAQDRQELLSFSDEMLTSLQYFTLANAEKLLLTGFQQVDSEQVRDQLESQLAVLNVTPLQERVIVGLILVTVQPNLVLDQTKTQQLINKQLSQISKVMTIFKEGQPIVYEGDLVTQDHVDILTDLGVYGLQASLNKFLSLLIVVGLSFVLVERFIFFFNQHVYKNKKYFVLIFLVLFLLVFSARLLLNVMDVQGQFDIQFLIPIPILAIILSMLVTPNLSLLCGTLASLLVAMMYKGDFLLFLYLFSANAVTTFVFYRKYRRSDLMVSGYILGLFNALMVVSIGLFQEINDPLWFLMNMGFGFGNGVVSVMVSLALIPYFESLFKITTPHTLLELSNLNHPLLKKLMVAAPGTYQHSIMVANLAEAAAEAVKADAILCRVGGYFHDIGKMKRPIFFTENQFGVENPHNELSPRISKMIISAHAKDGQEMGERYKLPKVLIDIILQHHGTTLVSFFYSQALHQEKESEAIEDEFRYLGPKPNFRESGILMLADSVEAAVRSLDKPTPMKIEGMVDRVFKHKLNDMQLVDCALTLKELETIKTAFLSLFQAIYHSRLDYQKELDNIISQNTSGNE